MNFPSLNLHQNNPDKMFENKINKLVTGLFGNDITTVINNGYFTLNKHANNEAGMANSNFDCIDLDNNERVTLCETDCKFVSDEVLKSRNLLLGKQLKEGKNRVKVDCLVKLDDFKTKLLEYECSWINDYVEHLQDSLTKRHSEGKPIIKHEAVRLSWARLAEYQETLKRCFDALKHGSILSRSDVYVSVPRIIRETCKLLSRLAGGRAFLYGQAVEMLWVFEIFNKIYFAGDLNDK